jgi:hypothetical protein
MNMSVFAYLLTRRLVLVFVTCAISMAVVVAVSLINQGRPNNLGRTDAFSKGGDHIREEVRRELVVAHGHWKIACETPGGEVDDDPTQW